MFKNKLHIEIDNEFRNKPVYLIVTDCTYLRKLKHLLYSLSTITELYSLNQHLQEKIPEVYYKKNIKYYYLPSNWRHDENDWQFEIFQKGNTDLKNGPTFYSPISVFFNY